MGDQGYLGINKPTKWGGMGLDYSYQLAFIETLGHIRCGGVPMAIGVQTDMATPALSRFGSDELCKEFLEPSIKGDYVACIGVSEVGAGSDVASVKTTARKDGADYVINGGKMWTTNGAQADWICLLANTGDGPTHRNKTMICVPMKTKGVTVARTLKKLGMYASDTAQIHFDDVRVPQRFRIGEEGMGFTYQMVQFQEERLYAALGALTSMQKTINETIAYTRERKAFNRPCLKLRNPNRHGQLQTRCAENGPVRVVFGSDRSETGQRFNCGETNMSRWNTMKTLAIGLALFCGLTQTNVMDVRVILVAQPSSLT
jgi:citronellyl-CoA dehydrogenase